ERTKAQVDGAYFRQIMLSELTWAKTIYIIRPLHFHWSGEMPVSCGGLEDLKTKMAFNGADIGEKNQIELVNKMLEDLKLHANSKAEYRWILNKYHSIALKEIEMKRPRGFFGYVFEDIHVFDKAYKDSLRMLPALRPSHPPTWGRQAAYSAPPRPA